MPDTGLLFVFAECGLEVPEVEFNDWYDNEHAPLRLNVPGITNGARYKATDLQTPSWVAIYETATTSTMDSAAYKGLASIASSRERALVPRLAMLNRRVYEHISESSNTATSFPAPYISVAQLLVPSHLDASFTSWCSSTHFPALSKVPGWLRGKAYRLLSSIELSANVAEETDGAPTNRYLILNEWTHDEYMMSSELHAALATQKMLASATEWSVRRFGLHKKVEKPETSL